MYVQLSQATHGSKSKSIRGNIAKRESERLVIEQEQIDTTMKLYKDLKPLKIESRNFLGGKRSGVVQFPSYGNQRNNKPK
jgi:hypothetical protein